MLWLQRKTTDATEDAQKLPSLTEDAENLTVTETGNQSNVKKVLIPPEYYLGAILPGKAISHSGGYFAQILMALNGSPFQNRALKTSENDGDFCIKLSHGLSSICSWLTFHDCSRVHFWPFQACCPEICTGPWWDSIKHILVECLESCTKVLKCFLIFCIITSFSGPDLPFLHPSISRQTSTDLLKKQGQDGSFLIRNSENMSGVYTICLL